MTHYLSCVNGKTYKIVFETDSKAYYELVQEACREAIDRNGKEAPKDAMEDVDD